MLSILIPSPPPQVLALRREEAFVPVLGGSTARRTERNAANLETRNSGFGVLSRKLGPKHRVEEPVETSASSSREKAKRYQARRTCVNTADVPS